jgi:tight adherence protein B
MMAGLLSAPISSGAVALRVSEGGGQSFPARSLVLSIPGRTSVSGSDVHITENGQSVTGAVVRPIANAGASDFGVVLAIDVSPSMKGAPLARAMDAARALAAQRTGKQDLAVVTFDQRARVALPLTHDPKAIARVLAHTPPVGSGAYIYNALTVAVQQLANAKIAAGAVILLSDGASVGAKPLPGHRVTATAIGAAAAAAHAQIYTVGLRDSSYTPQRMSLLARVGGGAFIESSSSQLASVFTKIEAGLTSAYVARYRSLETPGKRVAVAVTVDGIPQGASLVYDTPQPPWRVGVKHATSSKSFWVSSLAVVIVSSGAALLLALGILVFLAPRLRRGGLRRRVGEFTPSDVAESGHVGGAAASSPLPILERMLERTRWWDRFKEEVEIARIDHNPVELIVFTALGTIAVGALLWLVVGTPVALVLVLPSGALVLRSIVKVRLHKQRELFAEQLGTHLQELASAMRAGHSLVASITSMADAAPEPSHREWTQVVADEQLGRPLEEAMLPLRERMDSEDIGQVALVATLHRRTGGNMAEVLERVADSVRERAELRRELGALTAQARLSRYVVTGLPPVVAAAIAVINPDYIKPLFDTTTGLTLLFVASGLLIAASFVMRAITNIKV